MTKSCTIQSSALAQKTQTRWDGSGIQGTGTLPPPPPPSQRRGAKIQTLNRITVLSLLSLSLAFLGNCGGCGGSNGNGGGGSSSADPACVDNQILQNEQCEACTAPQFPNADRTACVANCPDGEYKPMAKPTCEAKASCTGREIHNPRDNSCFVLSCDEGEIADTTASPPACITEQACRDATGKLVGVDGRSCITEASCTSVANQLINERGECEACSGDNPVRNAAMDACISADECQTGSSGAYSLLGEANCITDMACQDMPGHVATVDGNCQQCTGEDSIRNMEKTACMSIGDCQSLSENAFSVLNDAECITDAACQDMPSHVAASDGDCMECTGTDNVRNVDKRACISATDCHKNLSTNPNSILGDDCITDADCNDMAGHVAQHDGVCQQCTGQTAPNLATAMCEEDSDGDGLADANDACPMGEAGAATTADASALTADPDGDGCKNSEDSDDDGDGIADADDDFPTDACASVDTDEDNKPDALRAGCTSSLTEDTDDDDDGTPDAMDVDDDGDGLIEIATYAELQNMKYDLAGASYKTGATAAPQIAGAPESATDDCDTAVDYHVVTATGAASLAGGDPAPDGSTTVSVYLCGYELTADIDASASCPNYDGTNGDDLTEGDGDDDNADDCGSGQSAWVPVGNCGADVTCGGSHADDDRPFTGTFNGQGHRISNLYYKVNALHGGLFGATQGASIANLGLMDVYIYANTNTGGLVGQMTDSSSISKSHVVGSVTGNNAVGVLVGTMTDSSISNSYAAGSAFSFTQAVGVLVGRMESSSISNSYAAGSVQGYGRVGGLVGDMTDSSSISNSYAAGSARGTTNVGGLVGRMESSSKISNSYAVGSAEGDGDSVGVLVGFMQSSNVRNSYATGSAKGDERVGGLVGLMNADSSISNSYAAGGAEGNDRVGGLVGWLRSGAVLGKSYYVLSAGTNGIGHGLACPASVCIQATGTDDASRRLWLQTADESTVAIFPTDATGADHDANSNTPNITWEAWDSSVWGNFTSGWPCLKDMPPGAPVCD